MKTVKVDAIPVRQKGEIGEVVKRIVACVWALSLGSVLAAEPEFLRISSATDAVESVCGENLVPNPGLEAVGGAMEPVADWHLPPQFAVRSGIGRNGSRGLHMKAASPAERQNAWAPVALVPGRRYRFSGRVKVASLKGRTAAACLYVETYDAKGKWLGGFISTRAKEPGDWVEIWGETDPIPAAAASGRFIAYFLQGTDSGEAVFDDFALTPLDEEPLGEIWSSAYRNQGVDGTATVFVERNLRAAEWTDGARLSWRLTDAKGTVSHPAGRILPGGGHETVTVDLSRLPPGDATLECALATSAKTFRRTLTLTRLAAFPAKGVRIDRQNRTRVDGRPFFPLGLWAAKLDKSDLDRIAASPFNVILPYGRLSRELMDYCHAKGLKVVWDMKEPYLQSRWRPKDVVDEKTENAWVEREVCAIKDHPALLAWYIADEMPVSAVPRLRKMRRLVERLDPDHPTWIVVATPESFGRYVGCSDVFGADPYPISDIGQYPSLKDGVRRASDWTQRAAAAFLGSRPVWMVPQCFDWATVGRTREEMRSCATRPPTAAEIRNMAWQTLVAGANGVFFFSYGDLKRFDWKTPFEKSFGEVCAVGREIAELKDAFLSDEAPPAVEVRTKNALVRGWRKDGRDWLVAVNATERPLTVEATADGRPLRFELPPLGVEIRRPAAPAKAAETPELVLGVMSDPHIRDEAQGADFEKALRWYDAARADAVLCCGDFADHGLVCELQAAANLWYRVFPNDRRSDGGEVRKLFHYGDHDTGISDRAVAQWIAKHPELKGEPLIARGDRAEIWERCFHEPWHPIELRDVKGYKFVLYHFVNSPTSNVYAKPWGVHAEGLDRFLSAHAGELKGPKPFFYSQHRVPRGTACGAGVPTGDEDGFSTRVLAQYPNCFAFCGHLHLTATDETVLWQDAFTALQVPSLSYPQLKAGRENGFSILDRKWYDPKASTPVRQMPILHVGSEGKGAGRAALLLRAYKDRLVIERRDVMHGESLGPDWVVPLPLDKLRPYSHAWRAAHDLAPAFPPTARATVTERDGKDRAGTPTRQCVVAFPPAKARGNHPRANDYEVEVELTKGDVVRTVAAKRVYSPMAYRGEGAEPPELTCVFAVSEIPSDRDRVVFRVRPVNAFGRKGEPLVCELKPTQGTPVF